MILDASDKSIQVVLAAAPTTECPITASYVDHTDTWGYPGASDTVTSGVTAVTAVSAPTLVPPATSIQRQVKMLTVYNADKVNVTVTVTLLHAVTTRIMKVALLAPGETLLYQNEVGFRILPVVNPDFLQASDLNIDGAGDLQVDVLSMPAITGTVTTDGLKQTDLNIEAVSKDLQVDVKTMPAITGTVTGAVTTDGLKAADLNIDGVTKNLQVDAGFRDTLGTKYGYKVADGKPRISSMPYAYDISEGNVTGHLLWSKIGYNGALVANTEADIWSKAGTYTFPTTPDGWDVVSSSAGDEDAGVSIFNGTSSGGIATSLIDVTKNFTAGTPVEIGDCIILDKSMDGGRTPEWGVVTAVAATTLTVANGFSSGGTGFGAAGRNYYILDKNSAGKTGAHAIKFEYLDGNYAQKSEIVILNGNAAVNTVNVDCFRVNSFRVIAAGSTNKAVGALSLRLEGGAATVYSYITAGFTRARNAQYTVPTGKTVYVTGFSCGYAHAANQPHYCRIYTRANREPSTGFLTGDIFYPYTEVLSAVGTVYIELPVPTKLPAKTDIKVSATADYAGITTVALRGWIEDA